MFVCVDGRWKVDEYNVYITKLINKISDIVTNNRDILEKHVNSLVRIWIVIFSVALKYDEKFIKKYKEVLETSLWIYLGLSCMQTTFIEMLTQTSNLLDLTMEFLI